MPSLVDVLLGLGGAAAPPGGRRSPLGDAAVDGGDWQYAGNPVGTSTTRPQQWADNAGPIDPVVGSGRLPVTRGQLQDMAQSAWQTAGAASDGGLAAPGMMGAIRAYHGSPHSFDRFDLAKIGTGEGAQAYGHGLYFAGNEGVARGYRDALSEKEMLRQLHMTVMNGQRGSPEVQAAMAKIDEIVSRPKNAAPLGHMYEVNLNTEPSRLLDWDKPLGAQPAQTPDALRAAGYPASNLNTLLNPAPGMGGYKNVPLGDGVLGIDRLLQNPEAVAALNKAGIPGIQYLDQGSRAAGTGSYNYVMFDPTLIDIMRKYAVPGAMVGGAATPLMQAAPDAQ